MALKSFSALHPLGRAGRGSVTVATEAMVCDLVGVVGDKEEEKIPDFFGDLFFSLGAHVEFPHHEWFGGVRGTPLQWEQH